MKESRISLSEKITFGLGAMSKDIIYWFIGAYLMLYFSDFYGLSAAFIGFILYYTGETTKNFHFSDKKLDFSDIYETPESNRLEGRNARAFIRGMRHFHLGDEISR